MEVYAPMTTNHADGTSVASPFTLPEELYQKWLQLAKDLATLAGERLAFVMNEILEHKRHKDAHKDGRGLPSRKHAVISLVANSSKNGHKRISHEFYRHFL